MGTTFGVFIKDFFCFLTETQTVCLNLFLKVVTGLSLLVGHYKNVFLHEYSINKW